MANAQPIEDVDLRPARQASPSHRDVWIRLDDQWWPGWLTINGWLELDGRWIVTVEHDRPGAGRQVGNYWYDREVIAPRAGDERPPDPA